MIGQNKASGLIKLNVLAEEGTTSYLCYCQEQKVLAATIDCYIAKKWSGCDNNGQCGRLFKVSWVLLSTQHKKSVTCNVRITETEQLVWPAKDSMLQLQRNIKNGLCGLTIIVSRIMTMQTVV